MPLEKKLSPEQYIYKRRENMKETESQPDRIMDLYEFEYHLLPFIAKCITEDAMDPEFYSSKADIIGVTEMNCDGVEWDWNDLSLADIRSGENSVLVFTLPEPYRVPLAKYAAIVVYPDFRTECFTLEKSYDCWMLCGVDGESHRNFGEVPECASPEDFVKAIEPYITD